MSFHPIDYAKAHPWTVGLLVVGGGVAFFFLSGWFSGGSSSQVVVAGSSGPTDAQLASSTNLALAQISAGVAESQTNGQVQVATIQSQLADDQSNLEYQLGVQQTAAGENVSLAQIQAQLAALLSGNQTQLAQTVDTDSTTVALGAQQTGVQNAQIAANTNIVTAILTALKPAPAPVPDPIPTVTQVVTPAPPGNVWDEYLAANPDVAKWAAAGGGDPNVPIANQTLEQRAQYQFYNTGESEGRVLPAA